MSYLGNQPNSTAFLTDQFSGNGSTTTFTLSAAPAGTTSILVSVSGVLQDPTTYGVVGTTLTLGGAAPSGTGNISVRYLGIPAAGVVTTAYRTVTEFTATAGQTTFTPPSYSVGYISVFLNGARLGSSDFTASNGTTVVLATAASVDDLVVTESFYISSVANAIPNIAGSVTSTNLSSGSAVANIGYTPVNKAGDTISGYVEVGNTVRVTSISNPSSGSGMELAYDGTQGVIQIYSNRSTLTSAPLYLGTGQLKFPSSQIASGNPNTLDDYEEGLWTLTDASGSGVTFSVSTGPYYVKIGKLCFVNFYVSVNSTSSSNSITIGGFPFAADGGYCYLVGRVAGAVSATPYVLQINAGQTTATMNSQIGSPGITWAQQSGNYWLFSGCYQTGS